MLEIVLLQAALDVVPRVLLFFMWPLLFFAFSYLLCELVEFFFRVILIPSGLVVRGGWRVLNFCMIELACKGLRSHLLRNHLPSALVVWDGTQLGELLVLHNLNFIINQLSFPISSICPLSRDCLLNLSFSEFASNE